MRGIAVNIEADRVAVRVGYRQCDMGVAVFIHRQRVSRAGVDVMIHWRGKVRCGIGLTGSQQGISAQHDLHAIAEAIAIGIGIGRVSAVNRDFLTICQAIAVAVCDTGIAVVAGDFCAICQAITVAVCAVRIRQEEAAFSQVVQAVAIGIRFCRIAFADIHQTIAIGILAAIAQAIAIAVMHANHAQIRLQIVRPVATKELHGDGS